MSSLDTPLRFSQLDGAAVGIWGAGRETRSFAAQLAARVPTARITVVALDNGPSADVLTELGLPQATLATGERMGQALAACDVVVRSPGVSVYRQEIHELCDAGIPVTTATGLWLAEREGRGVIAVTGTKGKSTTATLIAHLVRATGRQVRLAGNIGVPALDLLDEPADQLAVVELSSYQIADLQVGGEVVVITNLFREHVDWHGSEEAYRADKLRILHLPGVRAAVLNARDRRLFDAAVEAGARVLGKRGTIRSNSSTPDAAGEADLQVVGFGTDEGWNADAEGVKLDGELVVAATELPLRGEHNALNLCAALAALSSAHGIPPPPLPDALRGLAPLPHRLEVIDERGGVLYVDDSISTTPESTIAALASFADSEVVLIAGGQDRGQDFAALGAALARGSAANDQAAARRQGVTLIAIPTTGPRLAAAARIAGLREDRAIEVADMEDALRHARRLAGPGTVILLSPAAPSYDSYVSFEERGAHFRSLVEGDG